MRINHNIASMVAQFHTSQNSRSLNESLVKLSTGLRINKASDDAAGLATSENLRAQVRGSGQAIRNANEGIAMLEVAEGAAGQVSDIMQRMRELAVQGSNDTLSDTERGYLAAEFDSLKTEVDRITSSTEYNGNALLDGTINGMALHVGPDGAASDEISLDIDDISTGDGAGMAALDGSAFDTATPTQANALAAIDLVDTAIDQVNTMRANAGAIVKRLESAIDNLGQYKIDVQSAESRIRDVDFAEEMANYTRSQILTQAGTAMLTQANAAPSAVLSLFS